MIAVGGGRYAINSGKEPKMDPTKELLDRVRGGYLRTAQATEEGNRATVEAANVMERLKAVLLEMSPADLQSIGVTIKREEGEWAWLVEAMAVALDRCDRGKPAAQLRKNSSMDKGVTISITKHFLIELVKILDDQGAEK